MKQVKEKRAVEKAKKVESVMAVAKEADGADIPRDMLALTEVPAEEVVPEAPKTEAELREEFAAKLITDIAQLDNHTKNKQMFFPADKYFELGKDIKNLLAIFRTVQVPANQGETLLHFSLSASRLMMLIEHTEKQLSNHKAELRQLDLLKQKLTKIDEETLAEKEAEESDYDPDDE